MPCNLGVVTRDTASGGAKPARLPAEAARLDVLKALGDNTRYAIYLEVVRSPSPLATADVAKSLDLHVNTVRPHLERMRDVGLLELDSQSTGGVGRPQHRYTVAPDAPTLGLEPPLFPTLSRMLLQLAVTAGVDSNEACLVGHEQGQFQGRAHMGEEGTVALLTEQERLGFDPQVVIEDDEVTFGFGHCPLRDLAESNPDVVCSLHRGMVEGFVDVVGGCTVQSFQTLADRVPCQVSLTMVGSS